MAIELFLFATDPVVITRALAASINAFVIDWEDRTGCPERAVPANAFDRPEDEDSLRTVAAFPDTRRLCRINPLGPNTEAEVARAVAAGATDVLLPMVETRRQAETFIDIVAGRVSAGIMLETDAACLAADELARVPLDFVYVGLLDLAISRGEGNVFRALADGTANHLRRCFPHTKFGIGGLTVIDGGAPVPCLELMAELERLKTDFCFLRNSFQREGASRDWQVEVRRMRESWASLAARSAEAVGRAHDAFIETYGASRPRSAPVAEWANQG